MNEIKSSSKYCYIEMEYELLDKHLHTTGRKCFNKGFLQSVSDAEKYLTGKYGVEVTLRVINYPTDKMLKYIDNNDVGQFIHTTALVKNATDIQLKLTYAVYECRNCNRLMEVDEDSEVAKVPNGCKFCGSKKGFDLISEMCKYDNYRYVRLEEPLELRTGGGSREFKARTTGYLASPYYTIKAGDVCDVCGTLKVVFNEKTKGLEPFIDIWHIKPLNNAYEEIKLYEDDIEQILNLSKDPDIFKVLVDSIAPKVEGYEYIKEGLVLQMFEGDRPRDGKINNDERHLIHILLIGDPGLGKSRLIESIHENSPKAIKSNGAGTTKAGIIATASKDELLTGSWSIDAGAIVIADGGLLTIDEFDKLSKDVMKALNEPMEQLTVSVAKAGLVQTMTARTSVLAGANPKYSRFIRERSLEEQLDIPLSTISRFDLIYVMEDRIDYDNDYEKALKVLKGDFYEGKEILDKDILKKYINYAKNNIFPKLSEEANQYIARFYAKIRQLARSEESTAKPITLRELNAIKRLAIARAKTELRETVTIDDTKEAIRIYSKSLEGLGLSLLNIGELQNVRSKEEIEIIEHAEELVSEVYDEYGKVPKNDMENIILTLKTEYEYDIYRIKKLFNYAYRNILEEKKGGLL